MSSNCSECAFRREGRCLMRRARCPYVNSCLGCPDRVARVSDALHRHIRVWWRHVKDLSTAKKRFAFSTRKATGWQVFKTCGRKRRFRSEHEALEKAAYLHRRKGMVLAVYECPFCGGFHLTSQLRASLPRVRVRQLENAAVA